MVIRLLKKYLINHEILRENKALEIADTMMKCNQSFLEGKIMFNQWKFIHNKYYKEFYKYN